MKEKVRNVEIEAAAEAKRQRKLARNLRNAQGVKKKKGPRVIIYPLAPANYRD